MTAAAWHPSGMHHSTAPGDREAIEHTRDLVRTAFSERVAQGHSEAQALHLVAIDLALSLRDCALALERSDLWEGIGNGWVLELPQADSVRCEDRDGHHA